MSARLIDMIQGNLLSETDYDWLILPEFRVILRVCLQVCLGSDNSKLSAIATIRRKRRDLRYVYVPSARLATATPLILAALHKQPRALLLRSSVTTATLIDVPPTVGNLTSRRAWEMSTPNGLRPAARMTLRQRQQRN